MLLFLLRSFTLIRHMDRNKTKKTTLISWFIARLVCLTHLTLTIFVFFVTRFARHLFFIPIIGISLIILEIIVFSCLKFRVQYSFFLLLIYSSFIISSIWILELYKINHLINTENQQVSVEVFSVTYYAPMQPRDKFILYTKYIWSQIQIQLYVFFIVILNSLSETKTRTYDTIVKTWATALDTIDFTDLLNHSSLYSIRAFVDTTLIVWSVSCLQFVIKLSKLRRILIRKNYHRLAVIVTHSTLSVLLMDIPYLCIRVIAIFGIRKHDYTSYFLVLKNIFAIILESIEICRSYNETKTKKKKPVSL